MASQKTSAPSHTELADRLKPFGQEHLLAFWHELDDAGRGRLARQIAAIDLELLTDLFWNTAVAEDWALLRDSRNRRRQFDWPIVHAVE